MDRTFEEHFQNLLSKLSRGELTSNVLLKAHTQRLIILLNYLSVLDGKGDMAFNVKGVS